ncbi:MAG: fatty acid desaturase [Acidimicrobiales bacterium]
MTLVSPVESKASPRPPSMRTLAPWLVTALFAAAVLAGRVPSVPGVWRSMRVCLLLALLATMAAQLVTTLWLHRGLTHGAVAYAKPVVWVMRFVLWLLVGLKPWEWMYVHREHHLFEDTDRDVHSPLTLGVLEVLFNNVTYYGRAASAPEVIARWERFYHRDRWDGLFDRSSLGHTVGYLLAAAVAGPIGGLIIVLVHPRIYVLLSGAVNSIGHSHGYMRKVGMGKARLTGNSWLLAWLTWGEGLHDNHHISARSATMARTRPEMLADTGYWVIKVLVMLRLAEIRWRGGGEPGAVAHAIEAARRRGEIRRAYGGTGAMATR